MGETGFKSQNFPNFFKLLKKTLKRKKFKIRHGHFQMSSKVAINSSNFGPGSQHFLLHTRYAQKQNFRQKILENQDQNKLNLNFFIEVPTSPTQKGFLV